MYLPEADEYEAYSLYEDVKYLISTYILSFFN